MPDVKAAEDLNLVPLATAQAAPKSHTLFASSDANLTFGELIVPSVGYRQPQPTKPVGTAKVVKKVGQFGPKVLENWMLCDVSQVFISQIGGPNRFAQGVEAVV